MASRASSLVWKLAALGATAASTAGAVEAGGIALHGSLSLTGSYSDAYNYMGDTKDSLDLNVREVTLNGARRFENGLRASAQVYAYDLGGYSDITLDFASLDYSFNEKFGLRAGRNKLPQGLYGEVQDLDQVRTFASLPLHFYPRALRPMTSAYNGAGAYGNLSLQKAGSLDYQVGFGFMEDIYSEEPYVRGINGLNRSEKVELDQVYTAAVAWNTPLEGLKLSYTLSYLPDIVNMGVLNTRATMAARGYDQSVPAMIDGAYGAGAWDFSGRFAGTTTAAELDVTTHVMSAEYTWKKFIGAAEYKIQNFKGTSQVPALGQINAPLSSGERHYYVQGTYQVTDPVSVGIYYANSDYDPKDLRQEPYTRVRDYAVAASYTLTENWLLKFEAHHLNGLGGLGKTGDVNPVTRDKSWNYLMVKTTYSF